MKKKMFAVCLSGLLIFSAFIPVFADDHAPAFDGQIGLQLYSIRNIFKNDLDEGMTMTRDWGFHYVEITTIVRKALPPEKLLAMFEQYGLKGVIAHFPYDEWKNDPAKVAKEAQSLKLEYAGTAFVAPKGEFDDDKCSEVIQVFNRAADELDKVGIKFVFHNHGAEFVPWKDGTLFDRIVRETDPDKVFFELDVLWTVLPGEDPVRLFERYPKRFVACHLKDYQGTNLSVPLGSGEIDFPKILAAAKKTAVKYYFLEDESSRPVEQIPQSLHYLKEISFSSSAGVREKNGGEKKSGE